MPDIICPVCHASVPDSAYFCPNCGRNLKPKPQSTGFGRQLFIYLVSFFLAPLGIFWAFKYLRQQDRKSKLIGAISILLPAIAVYIGYTAIQSYFKLLYSSTGLDLLLP